MQERGENGCWRKWKMHLNLRKTTFTLQTPIAFGISLKGKKSYQDKRKDDSTPELPSPLQGRN
jgi:hypothetical protein